MIDPIEPIRLMSFCYPCPTMDWFTRFAAFGIVKLTCPNGVTDQLPPVWHSELLLPKSHGYRRVTSTIGDSLWHNLQGKSGFTTVPRAEGYQAGAWIETPLPGLDPERIRVWMTEESGSYDFLGVPRARFKCWHRSPYRWWCTEAAAAALSGLGLSGYVEPWNYNPATLVQDLWTRHAYSSKKLSYTIATA